MHLFINLVCPPGFGVRALRRRFRAGHQDSEVVEIGAQGSFRMAVAGGFPNSRPRLLEAARKAGQQPSTPKPGGHRMHMAGAAIAHNPCAIMNFASAN